MQGEYNMNNLLPAKQTDFIIGVIGEEGGFICSVIVIAVLVVMILRCFYIASKSMDKMGASIAVGVGIMFLFHLLLHQ
jgi:rod shape determining protein RodA